VEALGAQVVCLTFERYGVGSDKDRYVRICGGDLSLCARSLWRAAPF
jgi:hypothetical protein